MLQYCSMALQCSHVKRYNVTMVTTTWTTDRYDLWICMVCDCEVIWLRARALVWLSYLVFVHFNLILHLQCVALMPQYWVVLLYLMTYWEMSHCISFWLYLMIYKCLTGEHLNMIFSYYDISWHTEERVTMMISYYDISWHIKERLIMIISYYDISWHIKERLTMIISYYDISWHTEERLAMIISYYDISWHTERYLPASHSTYKGSKCVPVYCIKCD